VCRLAVPNTCRRKFTEGSSTSHRAGKTQEMSAATILGVTAEELAQLKQDPDQLVEHVVSHVEKVQRELDQERAERVSSEINAGS
jgi:hypothetical protein